jgi:hypothetical protein
MLRRNAWLVAAAMLVACGGMARGEEPADPALERTRKLVRMIDDFHKTAVVLITKHYVNETSDLSAGSAAIALFDAMKKKGWYEARLLDATGDPIQPKNSPQDDFEKKAIKELKSGKAYYDEVTTKEGKRYLRAATAVPVVMQKCTLCHEHYKQAKEGEPIGAIGYLLPVE